MSAIAHGVNTALDDFPLDRRSCQLLGPTALVVQTLIGFLIMLSLIYKRQREPRKRPWKIWLFDVSKQVAGQSFVHGLNVLISDVGSHRYSGNACTYYFLNVLIDATLGVAFIYLVLPATTWLLFKTLGLKGLQSGQYGDPPSFQYWSRQTAVYVFVLTTMKLLVVVVLATWPWISAFGDWLLSWTRIVNGEGLQLVVVMGIFPIFMNIVQFWLIDSIVKASGTPVDPSRPRYSDAQDHEPLFRPSADDDDAPPCDVESELLSSGSGLSSEITTLVNVGDKFKSLGSMPSPLVVPPDSVSLITHDNLPYSWGDSSISPRNHPSPLSSLEHKSVCIAEPDPPNLCHAVPYAEKRRAKNTSLVTNQGTPRKEF